MDMFDYIHTDIELPDLTQRARKLDKVWMMGHCLGANDMRMWSGFNARFHQDALPKQNVYYMPNLDKAPTKDDVVAETMRISKRCAEECGQMYALVTYDLDVAKKAHKIQVTDQPEFDDVFIMFGMFHIQLCHFRSIGKMIAESGGPELLIESGVLASNSLRGLIECYNFNRCKRLHQMFALAMEILHFRQFLSEYPEKDQVLDELKVFKFTTPMEIDTVCESDTFRDVYRAYDEYTNQTLEGTQGPTPQFWMMYVKLVELYRIVDRACRENDVELFTMALTELTDLFFAMNRQNYARWMAKYRLDLMNIEITHPGLTNILNAGAFSVRRTNNEFARLPVDLTLEQTVNADAASRMTGFTSATNNYTAGVSRRAVVQQLQVRP